MEDLNGVIRTLVIEAAQLDDVEIGVAEPLADYDVDSLVGLEITVNLEKRYKVKIPPERYQEMTTIGNIAALIKDLVDAKTAAEKVAA